MADIKTPNRYIKSDLKTKRIYFEAEHPIRWSFMKILREYSTLKEFYPDINPYVEAYKFRDNMWALYSESLDGAGDPWMYLIDGPDKAMIIDTGFGIGDLKGLIHHLVGDKEIICVNTHAHVDHASGNAQFKKVYCHEDEAEAMKQLANGTKKERPIVDENGKGIYCEFDPADLIERTNYEVVAVASNYIFDLGQGYEVEIVPLHGHTAGMSGFLDKHNHTLFCGDLTSVLNGVDPKTGIKNPNVSVERLRDDLKALVDRIDEIGGVFPGHGMLDQTPIMLKYHYDCAKAICDNPNNYDDHVFIQRPNRVMESYRKYIQQGTAIRYSMDCVYKDNK